MVKQGVDMATKDTMPNFLRKVSDINQYIIQQEKEVRRLNKISNAMYKEIMQLKKENDELKKRDSYNEG